jgi:outer membrane murein-binding lipoprotein Lpp
MQRFWIIVMGALISMSLITAVGASNAKVTPLTRSELCSNLSHQFDEALETHATATQVTAAKALQRKGNRYCASKKQAQGIRMLANALKLLGVAPVDLQ